MDAFVVKVENEYYRIIDRGDGLFAELVGPVGGPYTL
jgi:hypothetical protein